MSRHHKCLLPKAYPDYVAHLEKLACAIHPLLDAPPVDIPGITEGSLRKRIAAMRSLKPLVKSGTPSEFLINNLKVNSNRHL